MRRFGARRAGAVRRRPVVRRRLGVRRIARKRVSGIVHRIKRVGNEGFVKNVQVGTDYVPGLQDIGNGVSAGNQFFISSPLTSPALAQNYDFTMSSQFMLNAVTNPTDLTNLFDRYKIVGVQLKIHYLQNVANAQYVPNVTGVYNNLPTIHWAFDGDDANIDSKAQILQKGYCKSKVLNANRPLKIFIKPRVTKEIYNSPLTTGYSSEKACWLDCNSSAIPHFGVKFAITDWVGGPTNHAIRITPTYYLAMRDTQ